jgi:hypothetical protein
MDLPANLYDLTSELVLRITKAEKTIMLRAVCTSMKSLIEKLPVFEIALSQEGAAEATSNFFSHFKGNLTVTSKCATGESIRWFEALIDAVQQGVKVEKISTLCINSRTASAFSIVLQRALSSGNSSRIISIALSFEGSSGGFRTALPAISMLSSVADEVDITADLTFRRPNETLWGILQQIKSLGSCFSIKDICIRFAAPHVCGQRRHCQGSPGRDTRRHGSDLNLRDAYICKLLELGSLSQDARNRVPRAE